MRPHYFRKTCPPPPGAKLFSVLRRLFVVSVVLHCCRI